VAGPSWARPIQMGVILMEKKQEKTAGKIDTIKTEEKIVERKKSPWNEIIFAQTNLLDNLECLAEMFELVLPILKSKDEERNEKIKALSVEIAGGKIRQYTTKSMQDAKEFLSYVRKMRRADVMFRQNVVSSIVSKFDEFFSTILRISFEKNIDWLKNIDKKLSYREILEIESLDVLKGDLIIKEIDLMMRDSHYNQITFLDSKLKLGIEQSFSGWKDILEITERRNLFVHTGGEVTEQYLENCKKYEIEIDTKIKEGVCLSAGDKYIRKALDSFYELCVHISQATVRRLFDNCFEEADKILNNESVNLFNQERWELAERLFEFALDIPEKLTSKGDIKYYYLINLCIALKFGGKDFLTKLHSVDWTPFHTKYHFAVAVLEERFEDAERFMRNQAVLEEMSEEFFKDWPLLRDFRKTDNFKKAYKDIFNKDIDCEIIEEAKQAIEAEQVEKRNVEIISA